MSKNKVELSQSLFVPLVGIAAVVALLTWIVGWALPLVLGAIRTDKSTFCVGDLRGQSSPTRE